MRNVMEIKTRANQKNRTDYRWLRWDYSGIWGGTFKINILLCIIEVKLTEIKIIQFKTFSGFYLSLLYPSYYSCKYPDYSSLLRFCLVAFKIINIGWSNSIYAYQLTIYINNCIAVDDIKCEVAAKHTACPFCPNLLERFRTGWSLQHWKVKIN